MLWLFWVLAAGIAVVMFGLSRVRAAWRRSVRDELIGVLKEKHPEVSVIAVHAATIDLQLPGGAKGKLHLGNLYRGLAMGGTLTPENRHAAVVTFAHGIVRQAAEANAPLKLETHGDRILPRLATESLVAQLSHRHVLPHTPSGIPGLLTTYVLDSELSVMYLTESHLRDLGIDLPTLHERALANLRRTFPALVVRQSVEQRTMNVMKAGDTFDAKRVLLVPEQLQEGEALAALIPDRETLVLAPPPADANWDGFRKLAGTPASPYELLARPLRVTRAGFEVV